MRAFSSLPPPRADPRRVDERFDSDAGVFSPSVLADGRLLGAFVSPETSVSPAPSVFPLAFAPGFAYGLVPASALTFFAAASTFFVFALALACALALARASAASIAATAAMAASTSAASAAASASASSANMARSPVAGSARSGTYHPETRSARATRDARASSSRTISINDSDPAAAGDRARAVPVASAPDVAPHADGSGGDGPRKPRAPRPPYPALPRGARINAPRDSSTAPPSDVRGEDENATIVDASRVVDASLVAPRDAVAAHPAAAAAASAVSRACRD